MLQRLFDEIAKWIPWSAKTEVFLLCAKYDGSNEDGQQAFLEDFQSRIWLTYRGGFTTELQLANGSSLRSDSGWGCMVRVMQMLVAQCLVSLQLGRAWRYNSEADLKPGSEYSNIISCFLDVPNAPLSLHSIVYAGQKLLGKEPSQWFGPTSAAQAMGSLLKSIASEETEESCTHPLLTKVGCAVFEDGAVYRASVLELFDKGFDAVIIFLCRRLGLDSFNVDEYRAGLEECFKMPEFQGLASGNSSTSAHYFIATHGDQLLFLDPHKTQPSLEAIESLQDPTVAATLHAPRPLPLRWSRLNPSVCLGFLVRKDDFAAFCERLQAGPCGDVFEVLEKRPDYDACRLQEMTDDGDGIVLID